LTLPEVGNLGSKYSNMSGSKINLVKGAKIGGHIQTAIEVGPNIYDFATKDGREREEAGEKLITAGIVAGATRLYPPIGVIYTVGSIISETETYKQSIHDARQRHIQKRLEEGAFGLTNYPKNLEFRQKRN